MPNNWRKNKMKNHSDFEKCIEFNEKHSEYIEIVAKYKIDTNNTYKLDYYSYLKLLTKTIKITKVKKNYLVISEFKKKTGDYKITHILKRDYKASALNLYTGVLFEKTDGYNIKVVVKYNENLDFTILTIN